MEQNRVEPLSALDFFFFFLFLLRPGLIWLPACLLRLHDLIEDGEENR